MTPKPSRMDTYFVYCKGTRELLQDRIAKRKGHFMGAKVSLLVPTLSLLPLHALPGEYQSIKRS
jgi:gluconate kinase